MRNIWQFIKEWPISIKMLGLLCLTIVFGATFVVLGIPIWIVLTAFPQLYIVGIVVFVLLIIGYIKGKRMDNSQ